MAAAPQAPCGAVYAGAAANSSPHVFDPTGKYKLVFHGAFAAVEAAVSSGDGIKSESGAMVTMSNNLELRAKMEGGFGASLLRCCCTGESFFMTHFSLAPGKGTRGDVLLAPSVPGEIIMLNLNGHTSWSIKPTSFLAADEHVATGTRALGIGQGCCGGNGFFVIEAKGPGRLLANSYGSVARYDLQPGEQRVVDNTNLVAWTSDMRFEVKMAAKSIGTSLFSEGFVCMFTGPGVVYTQSHSIRALAKALAPYIRTQNGS